MSILFSLSTAVCNDLIFSQICVFNLPTSQTVLAVSQYRLNEELGKGILRLTVELDMEWIKFTERKAAAEMIIRSGYKKILYLSLLYLSPGENSGRKRFVKLISFKKSFCRL